MIALGSRNQLGNVLHIVAGPESDLHADLYGAVVMDITDILQHMDPEQRVLISLTRGRPERTVDQQLTLGQIPHQCSFGKSEPKTDAKTVTVSEPVTETKSEQLRGRCTFCGQADLELLPLNGYRICHSCAQIELGRHSQAVQQLISTTSESVE